VLQLTVPSGDGFCINGFGEGALVMSYSSEAGARNHLCGGAPLGDPVGGSLPPVPIGQNLVSDFSTWTLSGGISYDSSSNEIVFDGSTGGNAASPLVRVDGSYNARLSVEAYATQPSPTQNPDAGVHFGSEYYAADGVTRATN